MPRPPREDIAAPPFPPGATWIGADGAEPVMERLTAAGPVLVHFFDFAQLNSVRTLAYLSAWHQSYTEQGLNTVGVHTPRYPFSEDPASVALAVERLRIPYPVLSDERRALWADYGCRGWPSLFLWSKGGALRWFHFGEGEFAATETAIRGELGGEAVNGETEPLRPTDAPGARVIAPSDELLPGGSEREPWRSTEAEPQLEIPFEAGGAYATLDGSGTLEVELDGAATEPITVDHAGLYELMAEGPHRRGELRLRPDPGILVYSVSFAAGIAGEPAT